MDKKQTPSFKIQIGSYNKEDGVVTYNIRVLSIADNSFHIIDRYRNMRSLWEEIRRDAPDPDRIPEFPPKKWFGSKSRDFLDGRKSALEIFFNTLLESPDKNVYKHILKYFKKLAKNREAKDAIANIEEYNSGNQSVAKPNEERKIQGGQNQGPVQAAPNQPTSQQPKRQEEVKRAQPKDVKPGVNSKDFSNDCNKIIENFNKKLIDLGYTGADAIQEIMNKGQTYINHFKDSGTNQKFKYNTKLLDIPEGSDENFDLLTQVDEEIENQNDEANDKLQEQVNQMTNKLYTEQYQDLLNLNELIFRSD